MLILTSGELEALEDLHMFRITKVDTNLFEYVYNSLFLVSIPCKNFIPIVSKVDITRYGKENTRYKDNFPKLSAFLLSTAKYLINEGENLTVREVSDLSYPVVSLRAHAAELSRLSIV